jgi:hypothetical protein
MRKSLDSQTLDRENIRVVPNGNFLLRCMPQAATTQRQARARPGCGFSGEDCASRCSAQLHTLHCAARHPNVSCPIKRSKLNFFSSSAGSSSSVVRTSEGLVFLGGRGKRLFSVVGASLEVLHHGRHVLLEPLVVEKALTFENEKKYANMWHSHKEKQSKIIERSKANTLVAKTNHTDGRTTDVGMTRRASCSPRARRSR